ncbi:uncharacterized protein LOC105704480 isoform X2 [Orussus abietinus]|uniref:uncharacterized protein LOC105704480 isoform X2 n=1 Tax=Orussus abietinus TaxID=222816 RepID=UPI0006257057|nr:uncharacterized protein LOC105704480 isoform X2 [Orussus abietinus]
MLERRREFGVEGETGSPQRGPRGPERARRGGIAALVTGWKFCRGASQGVPGAPAQPLRTLCPMTRRSQASGLNLTGTSLRPRLRLRRSSRQKPEHVLSNEFHIVETEYKTALYRKTTTDGLHI